MARLIVGAVLMPSALFAVWAAVRTVAGLTARSQATWPFLFGLAALACWWAFMRFVIEEAKGPLGWFASLSRRVYVLGHEATHALAAWSVGAKVHDIQVGDAGGHVDLSHSNAFIALAPYCFPIYTLLTVVVYRAVLYLRPAYAHRTVFLIAMGLTVAFHLIKTFETIFDREQPDLPAAGGVVFSMSWILLANSLAVTLLVKALFPSAVDLMDSARVVAASTSAFWRGAYALVEPLRHSFVAQLKRP